MSQISQRERSLPLFSPIGGWRLLGVGSHRVGRDVVIVLEGSDDQVCVRVAAVVIIFFDCDVPILAASWLML